MVVCRPKHSLSNFHGSVHTRLPIRGLSSPQAPEDKIGCLICDGYKSSSKGRLLTVVRKTTEIGIVKSFLFQTKRPELKWSMRQEIGNRLEEAATLSIVNYLIAQKRSEMKNTCSFIHMIILNGSHKTIQFIEQRLKKVTCFTQNVIKAGERGATLRSIMFMQFRKNEFSVVIIR